MGQERRGGGGRGRGGGGLSKARGNMGPAHRRRQVKNVGLIYVFIGKRAQRARHNQECTNSS